MGFLTGNISSEIINLIYIKLIYINFVGIILPLEAGNRPTGPTSPLEAGNRPTTNYSIK